MAHYEGETLKERIDRGPLKLDDAIDIIAPAAPVGQRMAANCIDALGRALASRS